LQTVQVFHELERCYRVHEHVVVSVVAHDARHRVEDRRENAVHPGHVVVVQRDENHTAPRPIAQRCMSGGKSIRRDTRDVGL